MNATEKDRFTDKLDQHIQNETSDLSDDDYLDVLDDLMGRINSAIEAKREEMDE